MGRRLARLKRLSVPADEAIVWEGEPGEECYLLRRGRAEVVVEQGEGGGERSLATVGPGSLLGEAALLTDEPRNGENARALRPPGGHRRGPAHRRTDARTSSTGETITVLKDFERGSVRETVRVIDG